MPPIRRGRGNHDALVAVEDLSNVLWHIEVVQGSCGHEQPEPERNEEGVGAEFEVGVVSQLLAGPCGFESFEDELSERSYDP